MGGRLLVEPCDALLLGEVARVFGAVGEEIVDLCEAEILAVVVGLGHYENQ